MDADILIYNDNGTAFSDFITFECYHLVPLTSLSQATYNSFLLSTNHDPNEPWPFSTLVETGFLQMKGLKADSNSAVVTIPNASIYAVLIEGFSTMGYSAADLPLQVEDPATYNNAMLWSTKPDGT